MLCFLFGRKWFDALFFFPQGCTKPAVSNSMENIFLPPGFRFHPTDVELLNYYLKRKVIGAPSHLKVISELDLYKYSPWDLPGICLIYNMCDMNIRDQEYCDLVALFDFFFFYREFGVKYSNSCIEKVKKMKNKISKCK